MHHPCSTHVASSLSLNHQPSPARCYSVAASASGHYLWLLRTWLYQAIVLPGGCAQCKVRFQGGVLVWGNLCTSICQGGRVFVCAVQGFRTSFGDAGYEDLKERWQGKLQRATTGEQLWVKVTATKRVA